MSTTSLNEPQARMEQLLSGLLRYGALAASGCIAFGLLWKAWFLGTNGSLSFITAGVVIIILLPVLRVALMMVIFVKQKDYPFATIAGAVLGIIILGFMWGIKHGSAPL
jgi:uncharacterized membrane protein